MSQNQEQILTGTTKPMTWRTPGRKLSKEDLAATSALILGCTTQCCDGGCSDGGGPIRPNEPDTFLREQN